MAYVDSHYARTIAEPDAYPVFDGTLDVETLVIGGGLAGCAVALDLAERGRDVALVEAQRIGWGASGRNGGFASEGFPKGYPSLVARVGMDRAKEIQRVARLGLDLVRERIARYAIQCGPVREGALRCNFAGQGDDLLEVRDFMAENFGVMFEHWPQERLRAVLGTTRYSDALFIPSTLSVHPLNLTLGLARAASGLGARIFQESAALSLHPGSGGVEVRLRGGRIRAGQVVIAGGGYVAGLDRRLSAGTIPIATFVMATEPLGERLAEAMRVPYAIFDNQVATNYYRPLADGRVLWGGRVLAWEPSPARIARRLHRDMVEIYPSLASARVEVAWGGMMPMTRSLTPVIGKLGPDIWYATGFGGLGVTLTSAFGRLIAEALTEGGERWRLFDNGLPFAFGKAGRIPAQLVYWNHQIRAALAARAAA